MPKINYDTSRFIIIKAKIIIANLSTQERIISLQTTLLF